jgi:hypothetical protein
MNTSMIAIGTLLLASAAPAIAAGPACATAEYRQFDFWIGEWDVSLNGQAAGTNSITREHSGCAIAERWVGAKGLTGSSLNVYDAATGRWHQTWVDSAGSLLLLDGRFSDGAMRLASPAPADAGAVEGGAIALQRITWTPNADGTVRQLWEQSQDGGKSWTVAFDGLYRRKAGAPAAENRTAE